MLKGILNLGTPLSKNSLRKINAGLDTTPSEGAVAHGVCDETGIHFSFYYTSQNAYIASVRNIRSTLCTEGISYIDKL